MEAPKWVDLNYSMKNIPFPSPAQYTTRLIEMVESLIKRMRWRAIFFMKGQGDKAELQQQDNFGFKSRKCPPQVEELEPFENDLLRMVESVEFKRTTDSFQRRLEDDIAHIRESSDIFVAADKTRTMYAVNKDRYEKMMHDNVTKNYKQAPEETYDDISVEARNIANARGLDERMDCMAKKDADVTLKDNKDNFSANLPCRLINPAKSEVGKLSKAIL